MNNRTFFTLLVFLTAASTITISSAYAEEQYKPGAVIQTLEEARMMANEMLLKDLPVSIWTDKTDYAPDDKIIVTGQVSSTASGSPVTIMVISPNNSFIEARQLDVEDDGSFETTLNTSGKMWKYEGTYIIKVNYGSAEKSNSVKVLLSDRVEYKPDYSTPTTPDKQCGANELTASGQCIPFSISGGTVTETAIIQGDNGSIIIKINAENDGTLTVTPSETTAKGIFMVLVDGEECNEPECEIVGNKVTVMFQAGAETIEIVGTHVVPEFGTIAAMILAVAIISIVAVSAKSRLSIMPRY